MSCLTTSPNHHPKRRWITPLFDGVWDGLSYTSVGSPENVGFCIIKMKMTIWKGKKQKVGCFEDLWSSSDLWTYDLFCVTEQHYILIFLLYGLQALLCFSAINVDWWLKYLVGKEAVSANYRKSKRSVITVKRTTCNHYLKQYLNLLDFLSKIMAKRIYKKMPLNHSNSY